jgi:hypothetical protein
LCFEIIEFIEKEGLGKFNMFCNYIKFCQHFYTVIKNILGEESLITTTASPTTTITATMWSATTITGHFTVLTKLAPIRKGDPKMISSS